MKLQISLLMALFGCICCSCGKNLFELNEHPESPHPVVFKGDDDKPIIEGLTRTIAGQPVEGAEVVVIPAGQTVGVDTTLTNVDGQFTFAVDSGSYFFEVLQSNVLLITTAVLEVTQDTTVVIEVP